MAIDLKVTSTYAGKSVSSTVSDISPAATNAQLAQLGRKLIDFSDGTYEKGSRVETINVDTTPGGGAKPEPTLTLSQTSVDKTTAVDATATGIFAYAGPAITTNSDGTLYYRNANFTSAAGAGTNSAAFGAFFLREGNNTLYLKVGEGVTTPYTIYVGVTETDNYAAKEVAFTITA